MRVLTCYDESGRNRETLREKIKERSRQRMKHRGNTERTERWRIEERAREEKDTGEAKEQRG